MDLLSNGHDFQIHITKFKIQEFIKKKRRLIHTHLMEQLELFRVFMF